MRAPLLALLCATLSPTFSPADQGLARPGAVLEKVWGDGEFTEGPVEAPDGAILFSDIGNRIMRFDPATSQTTPFREPSGRANGLLFDPEGRLIAAEGANSGGGRRVSITDPDGSVRTLAGEYQGKRFNSPNDLDITRDGRVFVSDPRYVGDEPRELDDEAVYRIDRDGSVHRLETSARKPNGLALSPDGTTLYIADNGPTRRALLALPIDAEGNVLGAPRILKDFGDGRGIDGMKITADGLIVCAAGAGKLAGVYAYDKDGIPVGFIATPETPSNLAFAGPNRDMLYITAGKSLYKIRTLLRGQ